MNNVYAWGVIRNVPCCAVQWYFWDDTSDRAVEKAREETKRSGINHYVVKLVQTHFIQAPHVVEPTVEQIV